MATGAQIVRDFVSAMANLSHVSATSSTLSRNAYLVSDTDTRIVYIKGRSCLPYKWGVTANVIARLDRQSVPWHLVLLYECKDTGYLVSPSEVHFYMANVWPIARDGDYKPAAGTYLQRNSQIRSFRDFMRLIGVV